MSPKPNHLSAAYAAQFQDASVVAAYQQRPPYPAAVFMRLISLIVDAPRAVLDIGCGDGAVARELATLVTRVDAVDWSAAMIAQGKALPRGDAPNLTWIAGRVEDVTLPPPYALITAGASLHWMEWEVVLPRLRQLLTPRGMLAIIDQHEVASPWSARLAMLISRFSTNRDYHPYDLVAELEARHLFWKQGEYQSPVEDWQQPLAAYIEAFHSRNGFSLERMGVVAAAAFDDAVRALVAPFCPDDMVRLAISGTVVWGKPCATLS